MSVVDILIRPVDTLPPRSGLLLTDTLVMSTGEVAGTFARDLSRLGMDVDLVAGIGTDAWGRYLTDALMAAHVGTKRIRTIRGLRPVGP